MENKYWAIGTGANAYIEKFIKIIQNGLKKGGRFYIFESDKSSNWITYEESNEELFNLKSLNTAKQDLTVFRSFGFIKKMSKNKYIALVDFVKWEKLIEYSKVYLLEKSNNVKINNYRKTISLNCLVGSNLINKYDLEKLNFKKTKGKKLSINYIKKTISKYEKEIIEDEIFIQKIKENIWQEIL